MNSLWFSVLGVVLSVGLLVGLRRLAKPSTIKALQLAHRALRAGAPAEERSSVRELLELQLRTLEAKPYDRNRVAP